MRRTYVRRGEDGEADSIRTAPERPPEWPTQKWNVPATVATGAAALTGLGALWGGLRAAESGAGGESRFFVILAVLMLLTALFGAVYWWPERREPKVRYTETSGRGTTEVQSRTAVFLLLVAMVGCAAALSLGAAVEVLVTNGGVPLVSVVLATLGSVCVVFLGEVALGRIRAGGLTLGPDGIRHRGWFVESYLPWVSVARLRAVHHGYPEMWVEGTETAAWARRRTSKIFRLESIPASPRIVVDSRRFDIDASLLYRVLELYVGRPDMRAELGTPDAATRVRSGDLAAPEKKDGSDGGHRHPVS